MSLRREIFCLLLSVCKVHSGTNIQNKNVLRFPKGFQFGASTSAYQIEGGYNSGGKGVSIWDVAVHSHPSFFKDGGTGDAAVDSYHLYQRDAEIVKEMGLHFYRFSISWPRILPSGFANQINEDGVEYYNNLIDELIKNNVRPMVTLYHWDLPQELQTMGGWVNSKMPHWFKEYSRVVFTRFGDRVKDWVTFNEPQQICHEGYGIGTKAPFVISLGTAEYLCTKNLLLANAEAYHLYDRDFRMRQNGRVGISILFTWYEPVSDSFDDRQAAKDVKMFEWGLYADPIFSKAGDFPEEVKINVAIKSAEQGYSESRLPFLTAQEVSFIRGTADFFGVNSYTTKMVYSDASFDGMYPVFTFEDDARAVIVKGKGWTQAASEWLQEVPWGFEKVLVEIKERYNNPPVWVLENGWSTSGGLLDADRISYMRKYLAALLKALEKGCNIKGYAVWSLFDTFEWRNAYRTKFGLYEVDFDSQVRTRTPRKSAFVYKEIIRCNCVDLNYEPDTEVRPISEGRESETKSHEKATNKSFSN